MACGGLREVVYGNIEAVTLADVDKDGATDVRIRMRQGKARIPPQPRCEEVGAVTGGASPTKLPRAQLHTLEYLARGATLAPTPTSARIVKALEAMKPKEE